MVGVVLELAEVISFVINFVLVCGGSARVYLEGGDSKMKGKGIQNYINLVTYFFEFWIYNCVLFVRHVIKCLTSMSIQKRKFHPT